MQRNVDVIPSVLSITGSNLTTSYQGGASIALQGVEEIDVLVKATFDAATTLTSMTFRITMSDDLTNWDPVDTIDATTTAAAAIDHTYNASAGNTVRGRLQIGWAALQVTRLAKYIRVEVKITGTVRSGDAGNAALTYSHV